MILTNELKNEYDRLYSSFRLDPDRMAEREYYVTRIQNRRAIYEEVAAAVKVPWYLVAVIHLMESGLDFRCHLHNGDPLHQKTTHYPPGRPLDGHAPYTWDVSAVDALKLKGVHDIAHRRAHELLFALESYNGLGYRMFHPEVKSPYLWAGTNLYVKGKYTHDGKFDPQAVSKQLGSVPVLARLIEEDRSQSEQTGVT